MADPKRLSSESGSTGQTLQGAIRDVPTSAELSTLYAGVVGSAAPAASLLSAKTIGLAVAATIAGGVGGWFWSAPADPLPASSAATPPPAFTPTLPGEPERSDPPPPASVAPPVTSGKARVASPAKPSELALLQRARSSLSSNPAAALAAAEQHRRLYPNGRLAQEREVLAIDALKALGRADSARSRTKRFENAYPTSPHRERIRRGAPKK